MSRPSRECQKSRRGNTTSRTPIHMTTCQNSLFERLRLTGYAFGGLLSTDNLISRSSTSNESAPLWLRRKKESLGYPLCGVCFRGYAFGAKDLELATAPKCVFLVCLGYTLTIKRRPPEKLAEPAEGGMLLRGPPEAPKPHLDRTSRPEGVVRAAR